MAESDSCCGNNCYNNDSKLVEQVKRAITFVEERPAYWSGQIEDIITRLRSGANMQYKRVYLNSSLTDDETAENTGMTADSPLNKLEKCLKAGSPWIFLDVFLQASYFVTGYVSLFNRHNLVINLNGFTLGFKPRDWKIGSTKYGVVTSRFHSVRDLCIEMSRGNLTYCKSVAVGSTNVQIHCESLVFRGSYIGVPMNITLNGKGQVACLDSNGTPDVPGLSQLMGPRYKGIPYGVDLKGKNANKYSLSYQNMAFTWARQISATQLVTESTSYPEPDIHYTASDTEISGFEYNVASILGSINPVCMSHADDVNC